MTILLPSVFYFREGLGLGLGNFSDQVWVMDLVALYLFSVSCLKLTNIKLSGMSVCITN